ncbi:hypothetical protein G1H11_07820 [Phytoactinopolyspora alkaliphila]|uniref:NIPSNAP domain-containing protein n=1 Tax=Phytoactinopolyspora alkaliphila TaxID=1783498 RepID=A0A6N9YJJ1_9ACTN|nr:NIPSNAP family protein [Phytoactinopolyspora alkaliphila]NED95221.1 hypothetical protein [Phytoactinopolyspora alkaliphila]
MLAELRTYTISPGQSDALFGQFRDLSLPLFADHGITAYGPWRRRLTKGEQLVYIVEFDDADDRDRKWAAFKNDPRWIAAQEAVSGGVPFVAGNETIEITR